MSNTKDAEQESRRHELAEKLRALDERLRHELLAAVSIRRRITISR
ncbi:MAG TPA: hypothetical protein VGN90_07705 [Pyrinomonadaceae bacterium]|jgi:hypothetical protein|nr:hypothetical protein [Pyrinomonadaceae bacterium]